MEPKKITTKKRNHVEVKSVLPNGDLHNFDGPALVRVYNNGQTSEEWYDGGKLSRYNGPAIVTSDGTKDYYIDGHDVSDQVYKWLSDKGYEWETMSHRERLELANYLMSIVV